MSSDISNIIGSIPIFLFSLFNLLGFIKKYNEIDYKVIWSNIY